MKEKENKLEFKIKDYEKQIEELKEEIRNNESDIIIYILN